MDDDDVERVFANMAFNDYASSMNDFIEWTRVQHLRIQEALADDDHGRVNELAAEMYLTSSRIQVGNIPTLISGYAGALFHERAATVELHDMLEGVQQWLKMFHAHLVYVNQPNEELIMITDMMNKLRDDMDASCMGQTLKTQKETEA